MLAQGDGRLQSRQRAAVVLLARTAGPDTDANIFESPLLRDSAVPEFAELTRDIEAAFSGAGPLRKVQVQARPVRQSSSALPSPGMPAYRHPALGYQLEAACAARLTAGGTNELQDTRPWEGVANTQPWDASLR